MLLPSFTSYHPGLTLCYMHLYFTRNLPILYTSTTPVLKYWEPSSGSLQIAAFTGASRSWICWKDRTCRLLNPNQVSFRSAESKPEQDLLQYVHNIFTSVTSHCMTMSDYRMVLAFVFHPSLAFMGICIPAFRNHCRGRYNLRERNRITE